VNVGGWIAVGLVALYALHRVVVAWQERRAPRIYRVIADQSPFYGGALVLGTDLTMREAKHIARVWLARYPAGAAEIQCKADHGSAC
jgi:hypothetical protein